MKNTWIFDEVAPQGLNRARQKTLDSILPLLIRQKNKQSVLEAGCGIGHFSSYLCDRGLDVTAFDARQVNVDEARKRVPEAKIFRANIEDTNVRSLGQYDITVCLGLLYHLENPFSAIRNMRAMTRDFMIVESIVVPDGGPVCRLVQEGLGDDQAVDYVALIPSEMALVFMLYKSGFAHVYKPRFGTEHDDFTVTRASRRRRIFLVASFERINEECFERIPEMALSRDVWRRFGCSKIPRKVGLWIRKYLWHVALRCNFAIPVWGPKGGWFWCHNDMVGQKRWFRQPFEVTQRQLVYDYLRNGMSFIDIGANQGIYTVIASKIVGSTGVVHAFEPCRKEATRLERNLRWNKCRNVIVHTEAIGGAADAGEFCGVTDDNHNDSSSFDLIPATDTYKMRRASLDQLVEAMILPKPDLMKIDVDGRELDVLLGAHKLLSSDKRPFIIIKLSNTKTAPVGHKASQIVEQMEKYDYRCFEIEWKLLRRQKRGDYYQYLDLIAIPQEKLAQFEKQINASGWIVQAN